MARLALSGPFVNRSSVQWALHMHCSLPFWGREWEGNRTVLGRGTLCIFLSASLLKVAAQPAHLLSPVLAVLLKNTREMPTTTRQGANFQGGLKLAAGELKWDPEPTEDSTRHMALRCAM